MGFGFLLLMLIGIAATGYWGINTVANNTIKMLQGDALVAQHSARARANVLGLRRYEKDLFINIGSKEKQDEYYKKWKEQYEALSARIKDLEKYATHKDDVEAVQIMKTNLSAYESGFQKVRRHDRGWKDHDDRGSQRRDRRTSRMRPTRWKQLRRRRPRVPIRTWMPRKASP